MLEKSAVLTATAAKAKALSAIWTFPSVLLAAICIAWGAEASQVLVSQGLALAILAWLQTAPEFFVEGTIAWSKDITLMTANFTGATRLLIGFGLPLVYFTSWFAHRKAGVKQKLTIKLEGEDAVPVIGMLLPFLYGFVIVLKASLTVWDSVVLLIIYLTYLTVLQRIPSHGEEDIAEMERVPRWILTRTPTLRNSLIVFCFLGGGTILLFVVHPFVESMKGLAMLLGLSSYFFIQWVAPFMSEFPEFVSAWYWARRTGKVRMALMNPVSSAVAELTLLVAIIPIVYSISMGKITTIPFDWIHQEEILMTVLQATLGFLLLSDMRLRFWEATLLAVLWFGQIVAQVFNPYFPHINLKLAFNGFYVIWILTMIVNMVRGKYKPRVFAEFRKVLRDHVLKS